MNMKQNNDLVLNEKFRAMGTEVQIEIILKNEAGRGKAQESIRNGRNIFVENEKIFSRFNSESELCKINGHLGEVVKISEAMKEVLALCLKFNKIMKGFFDPRVIENLEKIGYDKDFQKNDLNDGKKNIPALENFEKNLDEELKLDYDNNTAWIARRIDTTGIAKGFTVDKVAEYLKKEGWSDFLVDAGGDMFGAGNEWTVGVEGLESNTVQIKLQNEGIATSGISRKRWMQGGQKVHHLINPKHPEEFSHDLKTVTVLEEKTVEADGRAKSLFLMGKEEGLKFANQENIKCLFLDYKNNVYVSEKFKQNLV
jgi:thiamine biosynthesis lipoprotein